MHSVLRYFYLFFVPLGRQERAAPTPSIGRRLAFVLHDLQAAVERTTLVQVQVGLQLRRPLLDILRLGQATRGCDGNRRPIHRNR